MLSQKVTTTGGQLPPQDQPASPAVGFVAQHNAANETRFAANAHARRMRRQRRSDRSRVRSSGGWSVGLW